MAIKGALKSVRIITADDLRENGGRWKLQGGPAIKVRGYTDDNIGGRKVQHGAALPVYVLSENDIRPNGGLWRLMEGQAIPVTDVIGDARGVIQGKAIPVWPVDDDGNFDSSWPLGYRGKVLATQPANLIAYWEMAETAGIVSLDSSGQGNVGAYTAVNLGQVGIGDGQTSAGFDGVTSFNNIYSLSFDGDFNGQEGTVMVWVQVSAVGVWIDGAFRYYVRFRVDGNNQLYIAKSNANNTVNLYYVAGAVIESRNIPGFTTTDYFNLTMTWSRSNDRVRYFVNGLEDLPERNALGVWAGALDANLTVVGAGSSAPPASVFDGNLAHCAVWDTELTQAEVANLGVI